MSTEILLSVLQGLVLVVVAMGMVILRKELKSVTPHNPTGNIDKQLEAIVATLKLHEQGTDFRHKEIGDALKRIEEKMGKGDS